MFVFTNFIGKASAGGVIHQTLANMLLRKNCLRDRVEVPVDETVVFEPLDIGYGDIRPNDRVG